MLADEGQGFRNYDQKGNKIVVLLQNLISN
jgi:hypothetical protein